MGTSYLNFICTFIHIYAWKENIFPAKRCQTFEQFKGRKLHVYFYLARAGNPILEPSPALIRSASTASSVGYGPCMNKRQAVKHTHTHTNATQPELPRCLKAETHTSSWLDEASILFDVERRGKECLWRERGRRPRRRVKQVILNHFLLNNTIKIGVNRQQPMLKAVGANNYSKKEQRKRKRHPSTMCYITKTSLHK